jgi:GT2 family glycosyltransferase
MDRESTISIVIISFNVAKLLKACLESIYEQTRSVPFDIWVIDNNSRDNSVQMLKENFPQIHLIENAENRGFTRANNQAVAKVQSDYVLLLNPDTVIQDDAIGKMVRFMDANPDVGVSGCRVLNEDGSLQLACRRSIPTPGVAFFRLIGFSKLFPKSRIMAKYNLTYLDPNEPHEVDAVSGAFLLIRKKVIDEIGLLDETFWIYGEDIDWCLRTKKAGHKVMYYPYARIIHYKGIGCSTNSRKTSFEFYRAMYLFHKKHFARDHSPIVNFLVYAAIFVKSFSSWRSFLFPAKVGSKG